MPELTPKLGIKKPLGNETVSRAAFNENWDIIDQNTVADKGGVPSIQAGPDANKPAPGTVGRLYVATDTQIIYRDTGTAWAKVGVVKWGDIDGKPSSFTPSIHGNEAHDPDLALASDLASHLAETVQNGVHGIKEIQGETTFFSTLGRTITHDLGHTNYIVNVVPIQDTGGDLGDVFISKASNAFTVYNTGGFTGSFRYQLMT